MKAVVFKGNRQLELQDFPDPSPGPGEVVVEMKASGMCGSDLKPYRVQGGPAALGLGKATGPVIAGHEPCGVVAEIGAGVPEYQARVGQRVMVHHYKGCGSCKHCRVGWSQLCRHGITVYGMTGHGGHAKYIKVPAFTLVPLPEPLSFAAGAAISCGTGTAYNALCRMNLTGRDTIAIWGQGPVGLSATQLALEMGARVIALEINEERAALAKQLGAEVVINPHKDDPIPILHDLTGGDGVSKALDCSADPKARHEAVKSTDTWGTVCFVGEGGEVKLDVSADLLRRQITVMGSWTFSQMDQAACARFIVDRKVDVDALFSDHYHDLGEAEGAYHRFDQQNTGKGVFLF